MSPTSPTTKLTVEAELRHLYARGGPFTTVLIRTEAGAPDLPARWALLRAECQAGGATEAALGAIDEELESPTPEHAGAVYVCAAADGHAVAGVGEEGPAHDFFHVGALPYSAPLLEWAMWRVPHLVVTLREASQPADIVALVGDRSAAGDLTTARTTEDVVTACRQLVDEHRVELIVTTGPDDDGAKQVAAQVRAGVRLGVDVSVATAEDLEVAGDLETEVVRQVADHVARATVRQLEDFRFLLEHDGAVQGINATLRALSSGWGDLLLVHDDPTDPRHAWFGATATEISHEPVEGWDRARLVDVTIRAAIQTGIDVRVVPSTGPQGPDDDIGLLKTVISPPADPVGRP